MPLAALGALLTLALLLSITAWMWWSTSTAAMRGSRERFDFKLSEVQFAIGQRLLAYEQVLRGGVALFAASEKVTRDEWRAYVHTLQIDKNFLGIQGIGYAEWLPSAQLSAHTRKVRAEGFPDYAIHPAGPRSDNAPIVYLEPFDWRNLRAFGYDMLSEPVLREAMLRARDSGLPTASGKVTLVQEVADATQSGFVMLLPVFRNGEPQDTVEARRAALLGYICASFRVGDLMDGILGPENLTNIQMRIFDGTVAIPANQMYDTLAGGEELLLPSTFTRDMPFEFDGRRWTLRFNSLPAFDATIETQKPRLILVGGGLISMLFAAVVWSLALNRRRARELSEANTGLKDEIAERSKLETALKGAKEAAEAANQAKSEFLANVSHELRTPLTLILAPLEQLLAGGPLLTDWRAQLDRAERNALLLLSRVNDILDYAKAEAGKFELSWERVDLNKRIGLLAEDAAVVAAEKQCAVTFRIDPTLHAVCLDPRYFEKIAMNLVSNAIKFTPAGGSIQLEATPQGEDDFEFAVADTGIGIPADKLPLLFQRFSQVDNSATRYYSGTGIGLALVKELVDLLGGSVGVTSQVGQGSRFYVRLPRGSARLACMAADTEPATELPPMATSGLPRHLHLQEGCAHEALRGQVVDVQPADRPALAKVLVVDDSNDMRNYVSNLLGEEWNVVTARDGEDAWTLLRRDPVDLVVSDVMMPRLDGFGLTARIKASAALSRLPVILLTARGGNEASVYGLEAGADDYIAKPFSPLELKARVRAALRMSQVQSELRVKSRLAGMAEIATNVLHNVGNILNSVNVSAELVRSRILASKSQGLTRAVQLMTEHAADLAEFLTQDPKGKLLPDYLDKLSQALAGERQEVIDEMGNLVKRIDHIKEVVATQQSYAGHVSMREAVQINDLLEDALRISGDGLARHKVQIVKIFADTPMLRLDKSRILQILVNLISNAKNAMENITDKPHLLTLQTELVEGQCLRVRVQDEGEGIAPENLTRIFAHGFTSRKAGHGFGLHSSILAATEMGGLLSAFSEGRGKGATFTLELPINAGGG